MAFTDFSLSFFFFCPFPFSTSGNYGIDVVQASTPARTLFFCFFFDTGWDAVRDTRFGSHQQIKPHTCALLQGGLTDESNII